MNPHVDLIDIDEQGRLVHPRHASAVPPEDVPRILEKHLRLREDTTDIFLYVHGWRTSSDAAHDAAQRLFALVDTTMAQQPRSYPRIRRFRPQYVSVRWPSHSLPTPRGYRTVRDRTAIMASTGQTARLIGSVLGYFNEHRQPPEPGPDVLASSYGQYLHCIGHSFGSRFLLHAILESTRRLSQGGPNTLAWPWASSLYPWTLDSLTLFQAALPADSFLHSPYAGMLKPNVLNAPIAMTFSPADRALGFWHRQAEERQNAIGFRGATGPTASLQTLPLLATDQHYKLLQSTKLLNIDASSHFRHGKRRPEGAHSDYFHPESAHLLLSLAQAAR
ncbi:hypothetical protein [Streptomyces sp. NBC_00271]|uniref:hypothetical protein n=1 Tax=Streptomyces sp. NBC_00271 TaxID=2975697 RepID=UPI002E2D12CE|nr:hypothetical protein [Streptomyces sp. NBC_00271]